MVGCGTSSNHSNFSKNSCSSNDSSSDVMVVLAVGWVVVAGSKNSNSSRSCDSKKESWICNRGDDLGQVTPVSFFIIIIEVASSHSYLKSQ